MGKVKAMHAAKQQDWQTPIEIFRWIEEELGFKFTLDPCTSEDNPLRTPKFYTIKDDGLKQNWKGETVYINPPYGELRRWVRKAHHEAQDRDTTVVGLLPLRTPSYMRKYIFNNMSLHLHTLRYGRQLYNGQIGFYFMPGRVHFIDPNTGKPAKNSPYFDSIVVVWK